MNLTNPEQGVGSPFAVITQLPYTSWTEFDSVNLVKATLLHLEQGQFDTPAQLVDMMTRDDRIGMCLEKRSGALTSLPLTFTKGRGKNARRLEKAFDEGWEDFYPDEAVEELMKWALMLGIGIGEHIWERDEATGLLRFRLKVWHPRFLYWRWDTRSYWLSTENGSIEVDPTSGQWLLFAPWGLERAWMNGLVRRLYVPWLLRQWSLRDTGRYSEVHGSPTRKAYVPANANAEEKARFLTAVARLSSDSTLRVPRGANPEAGYDVELLEATSDGWQLFGDTESRCNAAIAITILGQNLTTEVKEGALASTGVHKVVEGTVLAKDADKFSTTVRETGIAAYARLNYGATRLEELPCPCFDTLPPESKADSAGVIKAVGDGVTAMRNAGLAVDVKKLQERFQLPLDEDVDVDLAPAEPDEGENEKKPGEKEPATSESSAGKHVPPSKADVLAQLRVGELERDGQREGGARLAQFVAKLLTAVNEAGDFRDLEERVRMLYAADDDEGLAAVMTAAMALAELEGRVAGRGE